MFLFYIHFFEIQAYKDANNMAEKTFWEYTQIKFAKYYIILYILGIGKNRNVNEQVKICNFYSLRNGKTHE